MEWLEIALASHPGNKQVYSFFRTKPSASSRAFLIAPRGDLMVP